mmetsp:Transcript_28876/g.51065  ORF Transcript_28876/g.51065 Transcript_28876/m.51065 type:complete len:258 (-) Transcript_28876:419-1192(-)
MDVSCGWSRNAELDCLRDTIRIPSLVHATRQRWGHTREGWLKRLCLRADVCVTEVQPCFEVDVATCIMHLVEHRLAGRSLLFWAGVGGKCRRGKSKSPRSLCSNINECIKCGCIDSAVAICISLGETVKEKAVQLFVLRTVTTVASCYNPCRKISLASLHLAFCLAAIQTCHFFADVRIDETQPVVKVDVALVVGVDLREELHASLRLLLRSPIELGHSRGEAKAPGHVSSHLYHVIKVSCSDLTIKICIRVREALQ